MSPECEPNEALKRASFGSEDPSGPHAHPNPEPLLNASPQAQNPRRDKEPILVLKACLQNNAHDRQFPISATKSCA